MEPHYPKSCKAGRSPIGVPRMLRMYLLQQWYTLAEEAMEDALYGSQAMREFIGIDLGRENILDATTLPEGPCKALHEWTGRRPRACSGHRRAPVPRHQDLFGYRKVSYRGISNNQARPRSQEALDNP
jgi:hypothetical protein